jgi:GntR family transcriptional regulator, transcriptional repressor for pyruvate dehydrogenase complex
MALTKAASLADELVLRFEAQILDGSMPAGARFPTENTVAESFGVSRTVIREAYARLTAKGLIVSRRGSGAYVAEDAAFRAFQITAREMASLDEVINLLEMRVGFESEMAELAALRRTPAQLEEIRTALDAMRHAQVEHAASADAAFHAAIAKATGNNYFMRFTDFLGIRLVPSRRLYLGDSDKAATKRYAALIDADHQRIFAAIEVQDGAAARRAARRHIVNSIARHRRLAAAAAH